MNPRFLHELSLAKKGLIIISIPLVVQLTFFASYKRLIDDTDQIVGDEFREKNIIGRLNWITALVLAANVGSLGYKQTGDQRLLKTLDYAQSRLPGEISDTAALLQGDKQQTARMVNLGQQTKSLLQLLNSDINRDPSKISHPPLSAGDEKKIETVSNLTDLRHQLLNHEITRHSTSVAFTPKNRHSKRDFIAFGIFLDIVTAVVLFIAFSRTITDRLAILTDNATRYGKGRALNSPIGGDDEVAVLDKNLHEMVQALAYAQQQKKEYLQMISHDLRTPITNVLATLELMERTEGQGSASNKAHLSTAERNLERVLSLINQILDIESMEAGQLTLNYDGLNTTELFVKSVDALAVLAANKNPTTKQIDPKAEFIADTERLLQVLINLLGNAIKFSPEGSAIELIGESNETTVKISVKDHGRGIPDEMKDGVFERFRQVEEGDRKAGSGLGLAVCKAIVEAHKGKIGVDSKIGEGSTFWFELPIDPEI